MRSQSLQSAPGSQIARPGYEAKLHWHPYVEILHILEGEAEAWQQGLEQSKVTLAAGDTLRDPGARLALVPRHWRADAEASRHAPLGPAHRPLCGRHGRARRQAAGSLGWIRTEADSRSVNISAGAFPPLLQRARIDRAGWRKEISMKHNRTALLALLAAITPPAAAITGGSVDPALRGEWARPKARLPFAAQGRRRGEQGHLLQRRAAAGLPETRTVFLVRRAGCRARHLAQHGADGRLALDLPFRHEEADRFEVDFSNDKKLAARFPLKGPLKRCGA